MRETAATLSASATDCAALEAERNALRTAKLTAEHALANLTKQAAMLAERNKQLEAKAAEPKAAEVKPAVN